jgi:hypothetical protein
MIISRFKQKTTPFWGGLNLKKHTNLMNYKTSFQQRKHLAH